MKDPKAVLERNLARAKQRIQSKTMGPPRGVRGRNAQVSTLVGGRQYAIACEGTVITFKCKREGHVYKMDFASKRRKLVQRLTPMATRFQYRWWTEEKGGCIGECPACLKEHRKAEAAKPSP
jgi:hypothetical protein